MGTGYDASKAAVAAIQRELDQTIEAIRGHSSYSDAGRKSEMAKVVVAARARVNKMRSEAVDDRKVRTNNLLKIMFGNYEGAEASEVIANRDAQDRATQIDTPEDAQAMLNRARQNGDGGLARAVAEAAFNRGWLGVTEDYAAEANKRNALDLLLQTKACPSTALADSVVFRVKNPEELCDATEFTLRDLAQIHAPGME